MHEEGLDHHAHAQGRAASNRAPLIGYIPQAGIADNVCSEDRRQFALLTGHGKFPCCCRPMLSGGIPAVKLGPHSLPTPRRAPRDAHRPRRRGRAAGGVLPGHVAAGAEDPPGSRPRGQRKQSVELHEARPGRGLRAGGGRRHPGGSCGRLRDPVCREDWALRIGKRLIMREARVALRGGSPSSCFGTAPTSRSRREIVATRGSTTRIVRLRPARMGA